ncbi:ankyrin repeat-containing domain protein [Halteromyces radiatus]|uniref:ankyrin repeat-containing domain protein n=1 Tax=Halteromyces radiatus TaxID=101107 RepID=UPI0022207ED3|nr:ankyrin repeat-containing domain protein [Halteromyces radiatus]KAI8099440.1 ankyrin repeat-containing domain protein [Halteromyces radiatus]
MATKRLQRVNEEQPLNPRECLIGLLDQLEDNNLRQVLKIELKRLLGDHDRLVNMLQQRSELLENHNEDLKAALETMQQRHEKAVREMQFFRKKYERIANEMNANGAVPPTPTTTISTSQRSISNVSNISYGSEFSNEPPYHGLPPPPPLPVSSTSSSNGGGSIHSVPMTPVRSSTTTSGYTGHSLIQQRRVDPLIFGGADGLWDTIAKSKGSDVTVEKIISNFLRRGGSPNTAKQQSSSSSQIVKSGYGLIHALIVTKAPGSLDLLLQQGANPNAMTLSTQEEEKCSPCYLAAKVGWLPGLQKLVQAGGDLITSRGGGNKNKTVLHVAAEHCHAAVVEYIVQMTQGELNNQVDTHGATVLHYACASGHTDLVSLLARTCQVPVLQADYQGELPLHWAVRHGRLEVVTLLIERFGLDCNAYVPRKVSTPLDLAKSAGHKRLVDYLKGLGALSTKKMDKRREEELSKQVPGHFESTLAKHGLFGDLDSF